MDINLYKVSMFFFLPQWENIGSTPLTIQWWV